MGIQEGWHQVGQQACLAWKLQGGRHKPGEQLLVLAQERAAAWLSPMAVDQLLAWGSAGWCMRVEPRPCTQIVSVLVFKPGRSGLQRHSEPCCQSSRLTAAGM